eukprot:358009-Chlamydomonas_euryale.AAC.6
MRSSARARDSAQADCLQVCLLALVLPKRGTVLQGALQPEPMQFTSVVINHVSTYACSSQGQVGPWPLKSAECHSAIACAKWCSVADWR